MLLLYAALYDLRVETGDLACPFMQADTSCEVFARPLKSQEREGWIRRLHGATIGMRTALASVLTECMGFTRSTSCISCRRPVHLFDHGTQPFRVIGSQQRADHMPDCPVQGYFIHQTKWKGA